MVLDSIFILIQSDSKIKMIQKSKWIKNWSDSKIKEMIHKLRFKKLEYYIKWFKDIWKGFIRYSKRSKSNSKIIFDFILIQSDLKTKVIQKLNGFKN